VTRRSRIPTIPSRPRDVKRALVEAALELVRRGGPSRFSLREAARRVGVSQTAPYRHFKDKEALLASVAEEGFRALGDRFDEATRAAGADPFARYRAVGVTFFDFAVEDPARFRLMYGEEAARKERYPSLAREWWAVYARTVAAVEDCQRAGQLPPGDPSDICLQGWALAHGLAVLVMNGQAPGAPKTRRRLQEFAVRILFAVQPSPSSASRRGRSA
jgi:AcrR family transcriptional regulator